MKYSRIFSILSASDAGGEPEMMMVITTRTTKPIAEAPAERATFAFMSMTVPTPLLRIEDRPASGQQR